MSMYFLDPEMTAEDYMNMASGKYRQAEESFERCDTDGYLSQWASSIMANVYRHLADLAENGGKAEFLALADLEGNEVSAKVINGRYGPCWAIMDGSGNFTGKFVNYRPARESTLRKKGYQEIYVERKAAVQTYGDLTVQCRFVPDTRNVEE